MDYDGPLKRDDPLGSVTVDLSWFTHDTNPRELAVSLPEKGTVFLRLAWQADGAMMPSMSNIPPALRTQVSPHTSGSGGGPSGGPHAQPDRLALPTTSAAGGGAARPTVPATAGSPPKATAISPSKDGKKDGKAVRTVEVPNVPRAPVVPERLHGSGLLKVMLHKGTGLMAADFNGKSDPYVILQCGGKPDRKSQIKKGTLDPVWNEELTFQGTLNEFLGTGLLLQTWDWDNPLKMSKDDPLGHLKLPLDFLRYEDSREFSEALPTQGSLQFKVSWEAVPEHLLKQGTLHVYLDKGVDLKSMDSNGLSDPYVKLTVHGKQQKSKTVKKTLNPQWDESFTWTGVLRDLISAPMELVAMDYDGPLKRDDPLGNATVPLGALATSKTHAPVVRLPEKGSIHLKLFWQAEGTPGPPTTFARPSASDTPPSFSGGAAPMPTRAADVPVRPKESGFDAGRTPGSGLGGLDLAGPPPPPPNAAAQATPASGPQSGAGQGRSPPAGLAAAPPNRNRSFPPPVRTPSFPPSTVPQQSAAPQPTPSSRFPGQGLPPSFPGQGMPPSMGGMPQPPPQPAAMAAADDSDAQGLTDKERAILARTTNAGAKAGAARPVSRPLSSPPGTNQQPVPAAGSFSAGRGGGGGGMGTSPTGRGVGGKGRGTPPFPMGRGRGGGPPPPPNRR